MAVVDRMLLIPRRRDMVQAMSQLSLLDRVHYRLPNYIATISQNCCMQQHLNIATKLRIIAVQDFHGNSIV
jgi:hypothetical protein